MTTTTRECPIPEAIQVEGARDMYVSWIFSADENPVWSHYCNKAQRWVNMHTPDHLVAAQEPLTMIGSLICEDCNVHGFIREGRWTPA